MQLARLHSASQAMHLSIYGAASTQRGHFFLIHTKTTYVLAMGLGQLLSALFPYTLNATI